MRTNIIIALRGQNGQCFPKLGPNIGYQIPYIIEQLQKNS